MKIVDYKKGETLYYIFGRLVTDPIDTPGAHLILVGEPDPESTDMRVKRVIASCTSIEAATAAGRLLSGKAGREW